MLKLHTGRGSTPLSILLGLSSVGIVFFIFSGFSIAYKRLSGRVRNRFKLADAKTVILVGSENGSTYGFGKTVHKLLLKKGIKSHLAGLDAYGKLPNCENLVVFTSTYGLGDPPANGSKFLELLTATAQSAEISYSVLGFGSKAYPDFCKFGFEVNNALVKQEWAKALLDIHTVNDKSSADFNLWATTWLPKQGISFEELPQTSTAMPNKLHRFTVLEKDGTANMVDEHFILKVSPLKKLKIKSGDLLAIYPANDYRERLYSIGIIDGKINLSVRLHIDGLGSGFLAALKIGATLNGRIIKNPHFYFPKQAKSVVLISNGTGIAPFLGMIDDNLKNIDCRLYCGFKDGSSFKPYKQQLEGNLEKNKLMRLHVAFSRAGNKQYVSDLIEKDAAFLHETLTTGGKILICGSLSMQKDVFRALEETAKQTVGRDLAYYQARKQILSDCY
ncbi:flavodoxin domain-containing protein [Pedobacter sp. UYEF25]